MQHDYTQFLDISSKNFGPQKGSVVVPAIRRCLARKSSALLVWRPIRPSPPIPCNNVSFFLLGIHGDHGLLGRLKGGGLIGNPRKLLVAVGMFFVEGTPAGVGPPSIEDALVTLPQMRGVHPLHIWALGCHYRLLSTPI